MKQKKSKKGIWRRLYKYTCEQCGKKRHTYIFKKFEAKECRLCRGKKPDENQLSIFDVGASLHYVNQEEKK